MKPTVVDELSAAEIAVLHQVQEDLVGFSRGRYFLLRPGQPTAPPEIYTLRARGLVVLAQEPPGRKPPTRRCELTAKGAAAVAELAHV